MLPEPLFHWRCAIQRALHRGVEFREDDLWQFELSPDEPAASLLIYRVEQVATSQRIFYVVPFTKWVPSLTNIQREHPLFPMTEPALRRSVTKRLGTATTKPAMDSDVDYFRDQLRRDRVSLYDYTLQRAYSMYRLWEQHRVTS